ncbi:hypothetical protein TM50_00657 [Streptococcus parauberis]|nr:hypothetical protein TN39_01939 [Streptococcus parauberis]KYP18617.1 hypothetical protein AKL14_00903 [Streptococcus parauberis]KYP20020.1 hypothetical protein AKL13_00820 [Streptococcus parauberis]KYP27351.1 hypothetical protein TM50_00657 [Streptococcus parauberis]KYP27617.1 hypothetical protein TP84_00486 [Streptococcus parauberis]
MIKLKQLVCIHSFSFTREQIHLGNNIYQITLSEKCSKCGLYKELLRYGVDTNE